MWEQEKEPKKEAHEVTKSKFGSYHGKSLWTHTQSWVVLKLLLPLLLLCVVDGLIACGGTAMLQQPLHPSVNIIYDNAVQGLCCHKILQWVLHTNAQQ
ncbi:Leucine-rich repeat-containing protein 59 [Sciurus carolinensis]|uniref:Leucine-rich repeat-containing protein 59 n=1 Tax=Sciurus carolinensis TaxID=30640 RepID=A0AA41SXE7_SCICA|nr:Leucine-rich repeat-containing protein 59 [Sciurus carolinensis]